MKRLAGLLALLVLATAGCADDPEPGPVATGTYSWPPPPPPPSTPPPPCTAAYPTPMEVRIERVEEIPYRDQIKACEGLLGGSVMLVNDSDAAWTLETTEGPAKVDQETLDGKTVLFREAAEQVHPNAVMAPGSTVVVHAAPRRVHWYLSPGLSALWLAQEQLMETIEDVAVDQPTDALSRRSARRGALFACGVLAYKVARFDGSGLREGDPAKALLEGLGVAATGTECAQRWRQADDVALRAFGKAPRWEYEVAALANDAAFLGRANTRLSIARRAAKALLLVLPG